MKNQARLSGAIDGVNRHGVLRVEFVVPHAAPSLCLVSLIAVLGACGASAPSLLVTDGARDVSAAPAEFGSVTWSRSASRTLTLRNVGDEALVLGALGSDALGIERAFTVSAGTCHEGDRLLPNAGSCTLELVFTPTHEGRLTSALRVAYTDAQGPGLVEGSLTGTGLLDCTIANDLVSSHASGADAAKVENDADTARGTTAGAALTYDDGYQGGYAAAYSDGYSSGYHDSAFGYDAGYALGYPGGRQRGLADDGACSRGGSDGAAVGAAEGAAAGVSDGYQAGYNDGYSPGYNAGAADCTQPLGPQAIRLGHEKHEHLVPTPPPSDPAIVVACRQQGYDTTRNTGAYQAAYDVAQLHNAEYQRGITDGDSDGFNAGVTAGRSEGNANGFADGDASGYKSGANERYGTCYDTAYDGGYQAGYQGGYASGSGYDAGYSNAYSDGYNVGFNDYCPGA